MKVQLKNVRPNPFRDIESYPIDRQKVESLKKSIQSTEFWDNLVARKVSGTKDEPIVEIAYGHHRLTALHEMYSDTDAFDFIVKPLEDKDMIRIMADENMQEWGHDSSIERETVKAIVQAYADDKIALVKPSNECRVSALRYAPSFCMGKNPKAKLAFGHPYDADTIVGFLGGTMDNKQVSYALRALCLIEEGNLKESQLDGLSSNQARVVVDETNRAIKQAEKVKKEAEREALKAATPVLEKKIKQEADKKAKAMVTQTAKAVSTAIQRGEKATEAKAAGTAARVAVQPQVKELPEINQAASRLSSQIMRLLDPEYDPAKKLTEVIKHKKHLSDVSIQNLDRALEVVIEYAEGYRSRLSK